MHTGKHERKRFKKLKKPLVQITRTCIQLSKAFSAVTFLRSIAASFVSGTQRLTVCFDRNQSFQSLLHLCRHVIQEGEEF